VLDAVVPDAVVPVEGGLDDVVDEEAAADDVVVTETRDTSDITDTTPEL